MTPQPIEFAVDPGLTLRGQQWSGSGDTIILLHEPGEDHDLDRWRPLIPYLLALGATVISIDLRGHGASDGDWDTQAAIGDIIDLVVAAKHAGATSIVGCAAGESAITALRAAEQVHLDGLILLSPICSEEPLPRGAGESKLLISGASDEHARATTARLRQVSIGPALSVSVPGADRGMSLFAESIASTCREHVITFLHRLHAGEPPDPRSTGHPSDRFLELLGIRKKGVTE